jgi:hypothetical protein
MQTLEQHILSTDTLDVELQNILRHVKEENLSMKQLEDYFDRIEAIISKNDIFKTKSSCGNGY